MVFCAPVLLLSLHLHVVATARSGHDNWNAVYAFALRLVRPLQLGALRHLSPALTPTSPQPKTIFGYRGDN